MVLLLERQIPLSKLDVRNYFLYSDGKNITADGLRLMPKCNWVQLKYLNLSNNIFI